MTFLGTSCSQSLRAIGQALEARDLGEFQLEYRDDALHVHETSKQPVQRSSLVREILKAPRHISILQVVLRHWRHLNPDLPEMGYSASDIASLEQKGRSRRGHLQYIPDFYSLPELLRTVGAYVDFQGGNLLTIHKRGDVLVLGYEKPSGTPNREERTVASFYNIFVQLCRERIRS